MNPELQAYNDAIVNRAKIQSRLCCNPECEDCSWFDDCQGRVENAESALLAKLAEN